MANLHFSWLDSIQAVFSSCLPCLKHSDDRHDYDHENDHQQQQYGARRQNGLHFVVPPPRARPDELEGLLAGSDSPDAETLSLHSNIGDERRRKKRRKPRKGITLFGYNLFGRSPIHLDSDDEETGPSRRSRTISSSTLDSDAAPLDASALDEQAIARLAVATAAAEEEQRKAKEERRRLKRERKELKRMALAMAMGMQQQEHGDGGFEGFPGSGLEPSNRPMGPGSGSVSTSSPFEEEFGPFAQGNDTLEDDADFGAETYVRRAPHGVSVNGSASDSQSRTSASMSNADPSRYNHHLLSQTSPLPSPSLPAGGDAQATQRKKKSRSKSLSSKQSDERSHSTSSLPTSQSPSLPSPPPNQSAFEQSAAPAPISESDSRFEGFPGGTLDLAREHAIAQEATKASGEFPSVGLRGVQRTKSDMGVFLANRGRE
ncbi:hypothetical protein DAEQUDRAFT_752052 [Daedalea quercina L-15889]|uniref:Uncharacterized protein n=1 Tax=Daedalea quercina L-15889 TaxID=1314783 RepID=A0A165N7M3_9APHY|nr:hypothetical protein DAEQUDRAFT_752052 [Daedalea quercina L-15889]